MPPKKAPDLKDYTDIRKFNNDLDAHTKSRDKDFEDFLSSLNKIKATKKTVKKPTKKQIQGNIQKSRSDMYINPKTGKREVTTDMAIHKGLSAKEKAGLKKSILNAVKRHIDGSGLHIPLAGHYTSSLIFHEMGKYIPPKDRKLMRKLIEASKPPRPPPIHSGAIDEEIPLAIVPPMDSDSEWERNDTESEDSDWERNDTESEDEEHMRRIRELNDPDSDSDSDDEEMYGGGLFDNPLKFGVDKAVSGITRTGQQYVQPVQQMKKSISNLKNVVATTRERLLKAKQQKEEPQVGTGIRRTKLHNNGKPHPVLKRPRGRPRKITL